MIISASRRTDIPAFYSKWLLNRLRQGWCLVPNPFNRNQISRVSLAPADIDAIVFWTRNARPLMRRLDELDGMGIHYYFLITLLGYPARIDPGSPSEEQAVDIFRDLARRIGPEKVIWRYDPILLSNITPPQYHEEKFRRIAAALHGCTNKCVISFMKPYRKARARLEAAAPGCADQTVAGSPQARALLRSLSEISRKHHMEMRYCAGEADLPLTGVQPSRCIDAELISRLFGITVNAPKDPYQRKECGCAASRDIGAYETCLFGCSYCYATSSFERARANHARHDPESPSLIAF